VTEEAGRIQTYRDLRVWQIGMDLVVEVYRATRPFPDAEKFGLVSQSQRSAVSIVANIAEGFGRGHSKDYQRHLGMARGSLMELETHLLVARRHGYLQEAAFLPLWEQAQSVGRLLNSLVRAVEASDRRRPGRFPADIDA
jgi:four helix bundle protein